MKKEQLLKAIKGHRLYKLYHSPTKEIPRGDLEGEVNPSGQATERLFDLKRRLKNAVKVTTDFPHKLVRDNDEMQQLIQTAIVTLYADTDGQIGNADFRRFFDPLAGMVEGILSAMHSDDPAAMQDLRRMKIEWRNKAFMRQLKRMVESNNADAKALGKALSSMLTHVWIMGEKTGAVNESLVTKLTSMLESLNGQQFNKGVLATVRAWGLFEADAGMAPVTIDQKVPTSQSKKLSGLDATNDDSDTTTAGQPTGEKRWKGDKDGEGAESKVTPPQLVRAPGNPKDGPVGDEEIKPNKLPHDAQPSTIDGRPLKPDTSKYPATESIELCITEETAAKVCYEILHEGKKVGEASINRHSRVRRVRGKLESGSEFTAKSPAHARMVVRRLLVSA